MPLVLLFKGLSHIGFGNRSTVAGNPSLIRSCIKQSDNHEQLHIHQSVFLLYCIRKESSFRYWPGTVQEERDQRSVDDWRPY